MRHWLFAVVLLACAALSAPAGAGAATVVNGDFETGNLQGWNVHRATGFGDWYTYQGTKAPIVDDQGKRTPPTIPAPPQGNFAAISDELNPDTLVLYQDVALAAGAKHQLSLETYYSSTKPLAAPTPDTLSSEESVIGKQPNQQYRIDIMRPEAPLESIDPADVLRTIFRTTPGGPQKMSPTRMTATLTPFAGQTVRLRVAVVAGKEALNAGIDDVSISSSGGGEAGKGAGKGGSGGKGGAAGAKLRVLGHAKSLGNGRALLRVHVPAAGHLAAKCPKMLAPVSSDPARARDLTLHLKPTARAMAILERKHRLRLSVALTFKPRGEATQRATAPVVLKLAPGRQRR